MCNCRGKYAGIFRGPPPKRMAGHAGIKKVRYTGKRSNQRFSASIFSDQRYLYGTDRSMFFADARDLPRLMAWRENGRHAFEIED